MPLFLFISCVGCQNSGIGISDLSDSDSTILVSDMATQPDRKLYNSSSTRKENKFSIKGNTDMGHGSASAASSATTNGVHGSDYKDSEDELATLTEDVPNVQNGSDLSDEGSDVDSLHSYHYSPKGVDIPSAVRLAKRLFYLEGFKKSDVSRHLSKKYVCTMRITK